MNNQSASTGGTQMEKVYEDRVILFLDILGFRELIRSNQEHIIMEALSIPAEIGNTKSIRKSMRVSAFSDCIVVSDLVDEGRGINVIVHYASYLWLKFLAKGVLTRGGIAVGKLRHDDQVVFGPAMNEAYELEHTVAHFPRIVMTQEVRRMLWDQIQIENKELAAAHQLFRYTAITRCDFDGVYHVHTLGPGSVSPHELLPEKPADGPNNSRSYTSDEILNSIGERIKSILKNRPKDTRAGVKHDWLSAYLRTTVADSTQRDSLDMQLRMGEMLADVMRLSRKGQPVNTTPPNP